MKAIIGGDTDALQSTVRLGKKKSRPKEWLETQAVCGFEDRLTNRLARREILLRLLYILDG